MLSSSRRFRFVIFSLVLGCLPLPLPLNAQILEQSGDLRADIFSRLTFPRSDDLYRIPTQTELDDWRRAVEAILQGDLEGAAQLLGNLAPSYKVVRYTDTSMGEPHEYHLILEADVGPEGFAPTVVIGWGTYVFDPAPWRELSIQVPHPQADRFTEDEGFEAFLQLRPRTLLLAGTHRCASAPYSPCDGTTTACGGPAAPFRVSDASHGATTCDPTVTSAFHAVHEVISQVVPRTVALQFHGNSTSLCADVDVLLSNTGSDFSVAPDGNVLRLQGGFDPTLNVRVCDHAPGPGECNLCGTNNLQGRWSNGSTANACQIPAAATPEERFIHIEQNQNMRFDPANRQRLIDAIATTILVQEEPTPSSVRTRGEMRIR